MLRRHRSYRQWSSMAVSLPPFIAIQAHRSAAECRAAEALQPIMPALMSLPNIDIEDIDIALKIMCRGRSNSPPGRTATHSLPFSSLDKPLYLMKRVSSGADIYDIDGAWCDAIYEACAYRHDASPENLILCRRWISLNNGFPIKLPEYS